MSVLILLAACTLTPTTDDGLADVFGPAAPADPTLPPPTVITLTGPDFATVSRDFELEVTDALPEETVFIAVGDGPGDGPCRPWLGGHCMSMPLPLALAGRWVADGRGEVTAELSAMPWPGSSLCYQAVIRRGPAGLNSGFSDVHCVDFCAAIDSDDDGICDEYDICVGPDERDDDGDGVCNSVDPCPLDPDDLDTDGDGVCDTDDPCPWDFPDDSDSDGLCDRDDPCPFDADDACACIPSGARASLDTLSEDSAGGCWDGNPCAYDSYSWSDSRGQNFQGFGQAIACAGPSTCVAHVGITTYASSDTVCQGAWDVTCDGEFVGTIDTWGRSCSGSAMSNGCSIDFDPRECATVRLEAASDGDASVTSCCGGSQPDSMITAVSAW